MLAVERFVVEEEPRMRRMIRQSVYMSFCSRTILPLFC